MPYRIAGIDVHKRVLDVVVSDVEVDAEYGFERRTFGSNPEQLRSLAAWLLEQDAEEVVMNRRPDIGNQFGKRWSDIGSRYARSGKAQVGGRELCIWRRHSPIVDRRVARGIFLMPNA